jgi:exosortase E/protease (VPEID-CTERM system)
MTSFRSINPLLLYLHLKNRAVIAAILLLIELSITSAKFDVRPLLSLDNASIGMFGYAGIFLRIAITFVAFFFIVNLPRLKTMLLPFYQTTHHPLAFRWLMVHVVTIALFWLLSNWLFTNPNLQALSNSTTTGLLIFWALTGCASLASLMLTISPLTVWANFLANGKHYLILASLASACIWALPLLARKSWRPMADVTFRMTEWELSFMYPNVISDIGKKIIGTLGFQVHISPACSGYEGIGLVIVFLSIYLWISRKHLRFPHALFLYPIGISLIWLLNTLRITLLIILGSSWSPAIALGGFHSNAGWLLFVMISTVIVVVAQRFTIFNKVITQPTKPTTSHNVAAALLVPFIVLMASILITGIFVSKFEWLYPLRVIVSSVILWAYRDYYKTIFRDVTGEALLGGVMVFFLWIALVPASTENDLAFIATLTASPMLAQTSWLLFRFLGAAITVPIIEELVFRGYLMAKLINTDFEKVRPGQFTTISFLVSSIAFGALHGDYIAGILAGMAYALVFYRRGAVSDAITAHMTTNVLLAFYVMLTGHWALW